MLGALQQIWKSKDLRTKILISLALLAFVRVIAHIPLPGIDRTQLEGFLGQSQNQVFSVLSVFTGGSLANISIDLMGVGPYITASIVVQLMTKILPAWEEINKEGTSGREKLNQYTRYLTVPMAFIQGYGTLILLKSQNILTTISTGEILMMLMIIVATSIFVMWIGELISERGLGNGISLIIALGIIAGLPQQFLNTATIAQTGNVSMLIVIALLAVLTIAVIVIMNDAERKVPITYPRRVVAPSADSGADSYLPLKVNTAGVIPIIFALSFLTFPTIIARFLSTARSEFLQKVATSVTAFTSNDLYYAVSYFVLVFVFTFFYTYVVFQPKEISENLQKQGGFIPGIRPGTETAGFLSYTIGRLTFIGAIFLALIAILPNIMSSTTGIQTLVIGGTSILIVVSVVIETSRQLSGQLSMRRYDTIT
ncbi:MAG: preprotein translocase subunit SecY [Candidatus Berkelbacteria bacterium]|nr:preprotein translocase subunit SecY [Candidatus Berkelbacteria bacterium]MCR4307612.1 preprotein translocase subunit SecY [Candidatus Berkelbacteria bacterium]